MLPHWGKWQFCTERFSLFGIAWAGWKPFCLLVGGRPPGQMPTLCSHSVRKKLVWVGFRPGDRLHAPPVWSNAFLILKNWTWEVSQVRSVALLLTWGLGALFDLGDPACGLCAHPKRYPWCSLGTSFVSFRNRLKTESLRKPGTEVPIPQFPHLSALCCLFLADSFRPGTDGEAGARRAGEWPGVTPEGGAELRAQQLGRAPRWGQGGLCVGRRWPCGTGPQRLLAGWPGNRPVAGAGLGFTRRCRFRVPTKIRWRRVVADWEEDRGKAWLVVFFC